MTNGLSDEQAVYFLRRLRAARYKTLEDAEDFKTICFCLEELGCSLDRKYKGGLGECKQILSSQINVDRAAFEALFDLVKSARNDFSHRGVFARRIASRAVKLTLMLEESFMSSMTLVSHLMTEDVVEVLSFYTVAKVRELMLENSFSFLPCLKNGNYYLISDLYVAELWRAKSSDWRQEKHVKPLLEVIEVDKLIIPIQLHQSLQLEEALEKMNNAPALVFDKPRGNKRLVGILAPFDLL